MSEKNMGSSIDEFMRDEGVFDGAREQAVKEVAAWLINEGQSQVDPRQTDLPHRSCTKP